MLQICEAKNPCCDPAFAIRTHREPSEANIAGHLMQRIDFSGVGLYRARFVTEIRCHFVSFNLTARSPELLASLAGSLNNLSVATETAASSSIPLCVKDYAVAENLLLRVEPAAVDGGRRVGHRNSFRCRGLGMQLFPY